MVRIALPLLGLLGCDALRMHMNAQPRSDREAIIRSVEVVAGVASKAAVFAVSIGSMNAFPKIAIAKDKQKWQKVDLPVRDTLFDIAFDKSKPLHGWVVGSKGTFLETFDGGNTWTSRAFTALDEDEDINYRFEVASMDADEGWIIGKPALMLHTRDGGNFT